MNKDCIFKREDFILCDVPVPRGYHQSQTHAGVYIYNNQFFLTSSPYPNPKRPIWKTYLFVAIRKLSFGFINLLYKGEDYENPCIYLGNTFNASDIPYQFDLLEGNPLMDKPNDLFGVGSYNSDPDLFIESGKLYVLNRAFIRHSVPDNAINYVYLIQGSIIGKKFVQEKCEKIFDYDIGKSPCLTKYNGHYYLFSLETNSYNDGLPCKAIIKRNMKDSFLNWDDGEEVILDRGKYEPWHMSLFEYKGRMYALMACIERGVKKRCWQMLGVFSDDLLKLKIYQTPLTDYNSYRGAAVVRNDGEFILYNTTVHEKIPGSKSVDGRDIIMAHMPFEKLIRRIR